MADVDAPAAGSPSQAVFDQSETDDPSTARDDWMAPADDWRTTVAGTSAAVVDAPDAPVTAAPSSRAAKKAERAEAKRLEAVAKARAKADVRRRRTATTADARRARPDGRTATTTRSGKVPRARRVPFWRGRVLPKSVIGISMLILAFGLGAASSGTLLYMNYQYKRDKSDAIVKGFDARAANARAALAADATNARAQIQTDLEPLRKLAATGETLENLLNKSQPSIWSVRTYDVAGQAVIGSAFVVASDSEKSFLLTSYNVVRAATVKPGPEILLRKGAEELKATLWTWDESTDMALLILQKPNLPRLEWAAPTDTRLGTQVFALSGLGTAGGAITQGFVADVSTSGIQHTAPTGTSFQGGPIMNDRGNVVAVASRVYAPLGFTSDGVWFAPPVSAACTKLLKCPGGQVTGAGAQR